MVKKLEPIVNNDKPNALREYNSMELKILSMGDHAIDSLEEALKHAIDVEKYCSFIYDSLHPDNTGNYNPCFRIEKILKQYENEGKTKVETKDDDKHSPLAPIRPIYRLK